MSQGGTVLGIRVPGGRLVRPATDFEFDTVIKIASEYGLIYPLMLQSPEVMPGGGACMRDLYLEACRFAEVPPPDKITAEIISEAFEQVPDDLPEMYRDGDDAPLGDDQTTT